MRFTKKQVFVGSTLIISGFTTILSIKWKVWEDFCQDGDFCTYLNGLTEKIANTCETNATVACDLTVNTLGYYINLINTTCPNGGALVDKAQAMVRRDVEGADLMLKIAPAIFVGLCIAMCFGYIAINKYKKSQDATNTAIDSPATFSSKKSNLARLCCWKKTNTSENSSIETPPVVSESHQLLENGVARSSVSISKN